MSPRLAALADDTRPLSRRRANPDRDDVRITRCAFCGALVLDSPCSTPHERYVP